MKKRSEAVQNYILFFVVGYLALFYAYVLIESYKERTEIFTFHYVETEIEDLPEYFVMTLEKGIVYFRGNISEPKAGKRYRITYVIDHSVKVRRYVVKKCEAIE